MNTSPSTKFLPFGILSFVGLGVLFSPNFIGLSDSVQQARETSRIQSQEQLERVSIEQQAETSKLLRDKQLAKNSKTLIVNDYLYDADFPPSIATKVLHRYPNRMRVNVHSEDGHCIGYIENKKFYFRGEFTAACDNINPVKRKNTNG